MKTISGALLTFLRSTIQYNRADLIQITLANGQVIYATTAQVDDVVYGGNTYRSTANGAWQRGKVTSEISFTPKSNTMDLSVLAPATVVFPGSSNSLSSVVQLGLFDKALVKVVTCYWPLGSTPAAGITAYGVMVTFVGQITKVKDSTRSKIVFEVADLLYLLGLEVPLTVIGSSCRHTLFDVNCTKNKASYAYSNSVASGSNQSLVNLTSGCSSASFFVTGMTFSQGTIAWLTGQNAGLSSYIKQQVSNTQLLLARPLPFPIATGDTFTMYPGCDLTINTCDKVYNNLINIGSEPFVPNPEMAM